MGQKTKVGTRQRQRIKRNGRIRSCHADGHISQLNIRGYPGLLKQLLCYWDWKMSRFAKFEKCQTGTRKLITMSRMRTRRMYTQHKHTLESKSMKTGRVNILSPRYILLWSSPGCDIIKLSPKKQTWNNRMESVI